MYRDKAMIRLNRWHELTEPEAKQHRISDIVNDHQFPAHQINQKMIRTTPEDVSDLYANFSRLTKNKQIEDLQFWADFQSYLKGSASERCLYVKVSTASERLTTDLVKMYVLDEFNAEATLYLSLQWIRQQSGLLDRPFSLALRNRSVDQEFQPEDILLLYEYIRSGHTLIADKFHL